jgi:hypothetical protein
MIEQLGEASFITLMNSINSRNGQAAMVGATNGSVVCINACNENPRNPCCRTEKDQILLYNTAMVGFKINENFEVFMDEWRKNEADDNGHLSNISSGEFNGFMGGWI